MITSRASESILVPDSELLLYLDLPHSPGFCDEPHQSLCDILDLIVLMQQTNMSLDND